MANHRICPLCGTPRLAAHCRPVDTKGQTYDHPTCTWYRCDNPGCQALVDLRTKRALDVDGRTHQLG